MDKLGNFPSVSDVASQLINFEVYEGTTNRYIGIATIDLPKIEFETTDIKGSGINGTVSFPSYFNTGSMTCTLHWRSLSRAAHSLMQQKRHDLALYGGAQYYDINTGEQQIVQIKIDLGVLPKSLTTGKFEPSALMDSESEFEVIYLKILVDGDLMVEIDKFNYVYNTFDGQTWAQKLKNALTGSIAQSVTQAITGA